MRPTAWNHRPDCDPVAEGREAARQPAAWSQRDRRLRIVLRVLGVVDAAAFLAVIMPTAWMAALHYRLGLGEMPEAMLVGYLTRSASLLYALHGAIILFVSFDVERYRPLIRFLAWSALVHGLLLLAIDRLEGMPTWWVWLEGPAYCALGATVLFHLRRPEELAAYERQWSSERL